MKRPREDWPGAGAERRRGVAGSFPYRRIGLCMRWARAFKTFLSAFGPRIDRH